MELDFLNSYVGNAAVLLPQIEREWAPLFKSEAFKDYEPLFHKIADKRFRPDKVVQVPTAGADGEGNPTTTTKHEKVTRISIPLQRIITRRLTAFITGGGCTLTAKPADDVETTVFDEVKKAWTRNKLEFKNGDIVRTLLSQCECAEIWYTDDSGKLRCKIYAPADGYTFYPVFDGAGDMIAFAVKYENEEMVLPAVADGSPLPTTGPVKKVSYLDVYTKDSLVKHKRVDGVWETPETVKLNYSKIPVVYYAQDRSVWFDVQSIIDRLEMTISNLCDTNDYFAAPILTIVGQIMGAANKGETGKAIQLEEGAEADYLTWNQVPEAIKFEIESLIELIFTGVQCPNISSKELGKLTNVSGVAFDRIMIDGHLKAIEYHQGIYGEGLQRRANFLVSALAKAGAGVDLDITPNLRLFRINDQSEMIKDLLLANGNQPLMSRKDAIEAANLTSNADETITEIDGDEKRQAELRMMSAGHNDSNKNPNDVQNAITRMETTNAQNAGKN